MFGCTYTYDQNIEYVPNRLEVRALMHFDFDGLFYDVIAYEEAEYKLARHDEVVPSRDVSK